MNPRALHIDDSAATMILYMAMELSSQCWRLAFSDGRRRRQVSIEAGNLVMLEEAIRKARRKFALPGEARVVSCYEAGRDGFWLHRYLESRGIVNQVVDSSSIEVSRRKRRAKTDRIDAHKLLQLLIRACGGESGVWSVVQVPSEEAEDARRLHRELGRLKKERTAHRNRLKGLLATQGIGLQPNAGFVQQLQEVRLWHGGALCEELKQELEREYLRLQLVQEQIKALEARQVEQLRDPQSEALRQVVQLMTLRGIAETSAWVFVMEFFGWRKFRNRREVGALAGLTGTPYDSGTSQREQGISKAGNGRVRSLIIQIAWGWLRYQPHSQLSRWYQARFAQGGSRMRRIGIVALARRLLIALWRYLEHGEVPAGAQLKTVRA